MSGNKFEKSHIHILESETLNLEIPDLLGLIITPAVQYDIYISLIAFYFSDLEEAIYKNVGI